MTIISHRYQLIFIKTRKTAGTSIEMWLAPKLGPRDAMFSAEDVEPLDRPFFTTMNRTTRSPRLEFAVKRRIKKLTNWGPFRIHQHMTPTEITRVVGPRIWNNYTKVCVERDPWDRFISYWRFMENMEGRPVSLDYLLDVIEAGDNGGLNWNISWWSNWPLYTLEGEIVVDRILRYENLTEELRRLCSDLGIPKDGDLPRAKSGIRRPGDSVASLTRRQCERIANLFRREIDYFGYRLPAQLGPKGTGAD